MAEPTPVYCETAELAAEVSATAAGMGLAIAAELSADPLDVAARAARERRLAGAVCLRMPDADKLVRALDGCSAKRRIVLAALGDRTAQVRGAAADLGIVCVDEVAPLLSALALLMLGLDGVRAQGRRLSSADRARLEDALRDRGAGRLLSLGADGVGVEHGDRGGSRNLGHARDVASAAEALRAAEPFDDEPRGVKVPELLQAREILFGPPRLLSDPASKLALAPFGVPLPQEELCTSSSRASAEAARIGFPVRISLASPDLRVWDHPDLSVDGVDNAARVRDVYRKLISATEQRAPHARVLGVTVTGTTLARALLRMTLRPLPHDRVLLRLGFSDPHGAVARDGLVTILPASDRALERALERLAASALVLGEGNSEREQHLAVVSDLCARLAAFVNAYRDEVVRVELNPLALLVGAGAELREAAVEVTDAFMRELA